MREDPLMPIWKDSEICTDMPVFTCDHHQVRGGTFPICNLLLGVFHSSILGGMSPSQCASGKMKVYRDFPTKNVIILVVVNGKGPYPRYAL